MNLHPLLEKIFGLPKEHLVALNSDQLIPQDDASFWVGYRILRYEPFVQAFPYPSPVGIMASIYWRLVFAGEGAEEAALSTIFWNVRQDVTSAFESAGFQLCADKRSVESVPVKDGGFSDRPLWRTDLKMQGAIPTGARYNKPWFQPQ